MIPFYLLDVFTTEPFTGNPLAVVWEADDLSTELMRRIAGEFNQTETTFVLTPTVPDADWRLRSFTAAGIEVFGVGHHRSGAPGGRRRGARDSVKPNSRGEKRSCESW